MSLKRLWVQPLVAAFLLLGILMPGLVSVSRAEAAVEQPLCYELAVDNLSSVIPREDGSTALHFAMTAISPNTGSMQAVVLEFTVIVNATDAQLSSGVSALLTSFADQIVDAMLAAFFAGTTMYDNSIIGNGDGAGFALAAMPDNGLQFGQWPNILVNPDLEGAFFGTVNWVNGSGGPSSLTTPILDGAKIVTDVTLLNPGNTKGGKALPAFTRPGAFGFKQDVVMMSALPDGHSDRIAGAVYRTSSTGC